MCEASGSTDPTDLAPIGEEKGDESARLKEDFSWRESGHSKGERRDFSAVLKKNCVQRRAGRCVGAEEDPEVSTTELSGGRGTGMLSPAPEQDVCLLHEADSDQSAYP